MADRIEPARPRRTNPGVVWIKDMGGYELAPHRDHVDLVHRCGASFCLPFNGITGNGATYLAGAVATAADNTHPCTAGGHRG